MIKLISFIFLFLLSIQVWSESRTLVFEFDSVEGATNYEFEFRQLGSVDIFRKVSQKTSEVEITLPFNHYEFRQRTADKRKVPGAWSAWEKFDVTIPEIKITSPSAASVVDTGEVKTKVITVNWTGAEEVTEFEVEVLDLTTGIVIEKIQTKKRKAEFDLAVAKQYEVKVKSILSDKIPQDLAVQSSTKFSLVAKSLGAPDINSVSNLYSQRTSWEKIQYADGYQVLLQKYSELNKKWENVFAADDWKKNELDFDPKWAGGSYQLKVAAKAILRKSSKTMTSRFRLASVRTPAAEYNSLLFKAIDRIDGLFTQISWLVTELNLQSYTFETRTFANSKPLGGTVRAGLGYLKTGLPWGVIGFVNTSRMILNGIDKNFTGFEINGIYRKKFVQRDELRLYAGLNQKQIPIIIVPSPSQLNIHSASMSGTKLGAEYWYAIGPKWGLQANYSENIYSLISNGSSPNGNNLKISRSFQAGLLTSYQFSEKITGLVGLSHQEDIYDYEALSSMTVPAGARNSGSIKADYIGLMVEIGL